MLVRICKPHTCVAGIATLAVAAALLRMPYGYYTLLRFFICAVCVYYLITLARVIGPGLKVVLGACAVLYNPVAPVYLREKYLWSAVNVATLAILWTSVLILWRHAAGKTGDPS